MKTKVIFFCGFPALLASSPLHAASFVRWMGFDMNTTAQATGFVLNQVDTTSVAPFVDGGMAGGGPGAAISSLVSAPFEAGADMAALSGLATVASGTSYANTSWNIDAGTGTLTMSLDHGITGTIAGDNFTGSEGVFYFYALAAGTISITYDYGIEETADPTAPSKASERGRSRVTYASNRRGLGDGAVGLTEIVNRDGSRTITGAVGPGDDLIGLQFDFRISEDPQSASIPDGFMTVNFTPIPEPSTLLLGTAGLALAFSRRRNI